MAAVSLSPSVLANGHGHGPGPVASSNGNGFVGASGSGAGGADTGSESKELSVFVVKDTLDFFKEERKQAAEQKLKQEKEQETFTRFSDIHARRLCDGIKESAVIPGTELERTRAQVRNAKDAISVFSKHLNELAEKASEASLPEDAERLALFAVQLGQLFEWVFQDKRTSNVTFDGGLHDWGARVCTQLQLVKLTHPECVGFAANGMPRSVRRYLPPLAPPRASPKPAGPKSPNQVKPSEMKGHKRKREAGGDGGLSPPANSSPSVNRGVNGRGNHSGVASGASGALSALSLAASALSPKSTSSVADTGFGLGLNMGSKASGGRSPSDDLKMDGVSTADSSEEEEYDDENEDESYTSDDDRKDKSARKPKKKKARTLSGGSTKARTIVNVPEFTVKISHTSRDKLLLQNLTSDAWPRVLVVEKETDSSLHRVCKLVTGNAPQTIYLSRSTSGLTFLGVHANDQLPLACLYLKIQNVPPHGDVERSTADRGFETNAAFAKVFKFFATDVLSMLHVSDLHTYAKSLPFLAHNNRALLLDAQKLSKKKDIKAKIRLYCQEARKLADPNRDSKTTGSGSGAGSGSASAASSSRP